MRETEKKGNIKEEKQKERGKEREGNGTIEGNRKEGKQKRRDTEREGKRKAKEHPRENKINK